MALIAAAALLACNSDPPTGPGGGGDNGGGGDTTGVRPDTIAPATVTDPALSYDSATGIATFTWSAPHDDTPDQPVDRYEIRYALTLGAPPPTFWDFSIPVSNLPAPEAPGTPQQVEISGLPIARDLWVGIRSYDAVGNRSPNSNLATARVRGLTFTGRFVDVYGKIPVQGLPVRLRAGPVFDLTTDANGEFSVDDLTPGAMAVEVMNAPTLPAYHGMSEFLVIERDLTHVFYMIPVQPTISPALGGITLLQFLRQMTLTDRDPFIFAKWNEHPVACYIPPFVNTSGIDYGMQSRTAAQRWMDRTGEDLFEFVSQPPDTGIVVTFKPRGAMGGLTAVTKSILGPDRHPIMVEVEVADDVAVESFLYQVMLHEFGHTIRLDHAPTSEFIMFIGLPLPLDISDDEVNLVRLHQALPIRLDMTIYNETGTTAPLSARVHP